MFYISASLGDGEWLGNMLINVWTCVTVGGKAIKQAAGRHIRRTPIGSGILRRIKRISRIMLLALMLPP